MIIEPTSLNGLPTYTCNYPMKDKELEASQGTKEIYIHNAAPKYRDLDCLAEFHFQRGWAAIGYHFCIDADGSIFATRPLQYMGAHVYGRNRQSIGIAFFDLSTCVREKKAMDAFLSLTQRLKEITGEELPIKSHTQGQIEYLNQTLQAYNQAFPHTALDSISIPPNYLTPAILTSLQDEFQT
ncbi:MAG: N-acetylmuramoyl-L-alanine amidase, partial [Nanoarchaeota archaeon]